MFGRDAHISTSQIFANSVQDDETTKEPTHEYVRKNIGRYQKIFDLARKNLRSSIIRQRHLYNKKTESFLPGDLVMLYHPTLPRGASSKFHNWWTGPHKIEAKINEVTYRIALKRKNGRKWNPAITIDRLRRYFSQDTIEDLDHTINEETYLDTDADGGDILAEANDEEPVETDEEDPVLDMETEAAQEVHKQRVQPPRAAKLRELKNYQRNFDVEKQCYFFKPPKGSKTNKIYRLNVHDILAANEMKFKKSLVDKPITFDTDSIESNLKSKGIDTNTKMVEKIATLTINFHKMNHENYDSELPYHKCKTIQNAAELLYH